MNVRVEGGKMPRLDEVIWHMVRSVQVNYAFVPKSTPSDAKMQTVNYVQRGLTHRNTESTTGQGSLCFTHLQKSKAGS